MVIIDLSVEEKRGKYKIKGLNKAIDIIKNTDLLEPVEFILDGRYEDVHDCLRKKIYNAEIEKEIIPKVSFLPLPFALISIPYPYILPAFVPPLLASYHCNKLDEKIDSLERLSKSLFYKYN